jgi:hypothetical protein
MRRRSVQPLPIGIASVGGQCLFALGVARDMHREFVAHQRIAGMARNSAVPKGLAQIIVSVHNPSSASAPETEGLVRPCCSRNGLLTPYRIGRMCP